MARRKPDVFEKRGDSKDLIVMIHGFTGDSSSFDGVRAAIEEVDDLRNADLLAPSMPFSLVGRTRPAAVVASIIKKIDDRWRARESYERIYLIGHSMGGLFVRKAYVYACGSHPEAPIESEYDDALRVLDASPDEQRDWPTKVERIVLLAALNRGWSISQHLGAKNAAMWSIGSFVGRLLTFFSGERPLVFAMQKGSPFITQLRVQWIRMRQRASRQAGSPGGAVTVQLLGSIDDMVSPDDSIDVLSGRDFYYIDVPYSSHPTIMQMEGESEEARGRRRCVIDALTKSPDWLEENTIPPVDEEITVRRDVTDVVFVMHGIRDNGYWTQKIARRTIALGADKGRKVASETSTYGYFPMLPFIWPATRRKKVEWLMDQYAEAVAKYPKAKFSYMGHSNGTYLLARSLKEYPVVKFTNVVFAGSVVVRDYDWERYKDAGRINRVLNYTATADAVVAFFPKLFQTPRLQDLGSAGHDGFKQAGGEAVFELGPVRGGHSAARQEPEWDSIAKFLLDGTDVETGNEAKRNRLVAVLGWIPLVVWTAILAVIFFLGLLIWSFSSGELRALAFVGYTVLVWKVLTKV